MMLMDQISLDRLLVAAVLASLAVAIAFGPELSRAFARLRNRRVVDEVPASPSLGVEPQQF
jgi:hypothetical protein